MNDFVENPLNSFAVISFNCSDPQRTYKYEYLDIGSNSNVRMSSMMKKSFLANEQIKNTNKIEEFEYSLGNCDYYWVLNTGEEFVVSSLPMGVVPEEMPTFFAGPFLTEFLAKNFIDQMKYYLHDDGF